MRISVLILCLISGVSLPAQELQYFNRAGQSCGKAEAEYYRISDINHSSGLIDVQEYFMDGQLRMEGSFITLQPELKHGAFTYYHRNGIVHRETNTGKES